MSDALLEIMSPCSINAPEGEIFLEAGEFVALVDTGDFSMDGGVMTIDRRVLGRLGVVTLLNHSRQVE